MVVSPERIGKLTSRVRWLDRYRHVFAVIAALILTRFVCLQLADVLEADWDELQVLVYSGIVGVGLWWAAEVVFAYLTALWETELCRLTREPYVPRAILRRRLK